MLINLVFENHPGTNKDFRVATSSILDYKSKLIFVTLV